MRHGLGRAIAIVVAVALFSCPGISYGEAKTGTIQVGAGKLGGVLTSSAGKLLDGVQIRVMQGKKLVAETKTDKKGNYTLAKLDVGKYTMFVAGERGLEFEAIKSSQIQALSLVIPTRDKYAAAELGALTQAQWVWIIIGTAAVVAITVPVLHNTTNVFGGGTSGTP